MCTGVSHLTVPSDVEGVSAILNWVSFVPRTRNHPVPSLPMIDPVDRPIKFTPTKAPYDPRFMLAGRSIRGGTDFEKGFFDKGSFIETLNHWAMTVVTGRARLGGIPCGVIAVETRAVECIHPADPANPDTETTVS